MKKTFSIKITGFVLVCLSLMTLSVKLANGYGLTADGGIGESMNTVCTCSGGETFNVQSYVDNSYHDYLYYPGETTEYSYYSFEEDNLPAYFLANLDQFAICLVEEGEYCDEEDSPEATFSQLGDSNGI